MSEFITEIKRTHYCGSLRAGHAGEDVVLMGWVHRRRDLGGLIFIDLRDREGTVQIVLDPEKKSQAHALARDIRNEFVLAVRGHVHLRPSDMINPSLETGEIEVVADDLEILNESNTPPFVLDGETTVSENLLLKYRYLDLRRRNLQKNIILRSKVTAETRSYLQREGFLDIETPFLAKSTPEGARDYLVPSRVTPGTFYALPQSPQIFKQLLMVSGFDKYYQIVKCFRDEDLRADRQPEFTQIDMEMSFISEEDIMGVIEGMMAHIFDVCLGRKLQIPFSRLTYREAIDRYGRDNPDTRFALEITDLTDIAGKSDFRVFSETAKNGGAIKALTIEDGKAFSRKDLDALGGVVSPYGAKGVAWIRVDQDGWTGSIAKFFNREQTDRINERTGARPGSLLLFVADTPGVVSASLGVLRIHLAEKLGLIDPDVLAFTWITEFPMFEYSTTEGRYMATHHPFTSPLAQDISLIETDPGKVRARAYDLVLNGSEIGGGSIRIHKSDIQSMIFKALGLGKDDIRTKFGFFLDALQYGTPPHGGIAFGLDRLIMIMSKAESIRDVIAFPKTLKATCLMSEAPSEVSPDQLAELSLKTT
ncbi:MAG TPA: aspartate--tRNA ligase [Syntrophales bacterium]|nr:aspartate--tRNA ligase [Syntrophales bacterium]